MRKSKYFNPSISLFVRGLEFRYVKYFIRWESYGTADRPSVARSVRPGTKTNKIWQKSKKTDANFISIVYFLDRRSRLWQQRTAESAGRSLGGNRAKPGAGYPIDRRSWWKRNVACSTGPRASSTHAQPSQRRRCRPTRTPRRRFRSKRVIPPSIRRRNAPEAPTPTPEINFSLTDTLIIRRLGIAETVKLIKGSFDQHVKMRLETLF